VAARWKLAAYNTRVLTRDLQSLANTRFDLLIVGAGIYGATIAWDAARRGLSVALIDRGDFGGGTSANSAKTVHGGVRALQTGNLAELRSFVRERRALSQIAPHLVHPLAFVIPTYGGLTRNPVVMRVAFGLYDLLARDRNDLQDRSKHLPPSRFISRDECLALNPAIAPDRVTGGIIWHDGQMHNPDRVVLSFVLSAVAAGAVAANYVEATGWIREGHRIIGVQGQDRLGTARFDVRATLVVNAAGPFSQALTEDLPPTIRSGRPRGLAKAMNLVTRSITRDHAFGGLTGSRFLFVAPWHGVSIIGTSQDPFDGRADSLRVRETDVSAFLKEVNQAFPAAGLQLDDVRLVHRGLLPATDDSGRRLLKQSVVRDHRADGVPGLMSVLGVRYTTARGTAERATDTAFTILGRTPPACETTEIPLTGGDISNFASFVAEATRDTQDAVDSITRRRVAYSYGSRYRDVLNPMRDDPSLAVSLSKDCPVTRGEILHVVRHEMAVRLADAVLRRTEAGSAGHPGRDAMDAAARIMGAEMGWDETQRARELSHAEQIYRLDP
jgi:glycerol-3-phosphate dehydrogenase